MPKNLNTTINMFADEQPQEVEKEIVYVYKDKETKTERTQIVLRKSTKAELKKIAKKETGGSLNELISRICEDYIKEYQK